MGLARLPAAGAVFALMALATARADAQSGELDRLIDTENAGKKLRVSPIVDDWGFLRRVTVDLIGRIPNETEIKQYFAWPADQRRAKAVDVLMKDSRFTDRWTVFFADMLRVRSGATGGSALLAFVHQAVDVGMPYDRMCKQLIAANGRANTTPEVGFILGDDADPLALTGVTTQVFLGTRLQCAQCHNHPFDVWTRKQFYGLAAYYGKTRRVESKVTKAIYTTEVEQTTILWPPEDKNGVTRKPVTPAFPFEMDEGDGPRKHIARMTERRAEEEARRNKTGKREPSLDDLLAEAGDKAGKRVSGSGSDDLAGIVSEAQKAAKNLDIKGDLYRASVLRKELSEKITDPRNRLFSRNLANRIWHELMGRGFVEPVDDFTESNQPSHPQSLDYLCDEFVASGFDFRTIIRLTVNSKAYQRAIPPSGTEFQTREDAERAFVAAPVRRMLAEVLYDSIVQGGHLYEFKFRAGENNRIVDTIVREAVVEKSDEKGKTEKTPKVAAVKKAAPSGAMMRRDEPSAYDLETAIEVDFKSVLRKRNEPEVDVAMMKVMSKEEIEADRALMEARTERAMSKYIERVVKTTVDENPRFTSSMRMASPAPSTHFLRVFGQPARDALGDHRDHSPSMRQALMMLNGKLTHEASRVGTLEPIYPLLVGPKADLPAAVKMVYRELFTREPDATEIKEALEILLTSATPLEGMADLRWVLFNSHEFKFLP